MLKLVLILSLLSGKSISQTSVDTAKILWRDDLRCGTDFPLPDGRLSQCNPDGQSPCCSSFSWCGNTDSHCNCSSCVDYRSECELHFQLKGLSGAEKVKIYVSGTEEEVDITTEWKEFDYPYPSNNQFSVEFLNDNGYRMDVFIQGHETEVKYRLPEFEQSTEWGCGSCNEPARCKSLRDGTIYFNGKYTWNISCDSGSTNGKNEEDFVEELLSKETRCSNHARDLICIALIISSFTLVTINVFVYKKKRGGLNIAKSDNMVIGSEFELTDLSAESVESIKDHQFELKQKKLTLENKFQV